MQARRRRRKPKKSPFRHLLWIIPLIIVDIFIFRWLGGRHAPTQASRPAAAIVSQVVESVENRVQTKPPSVWRHMVPPTPQTNLLNPDEPGVLQPTGSGRLISAKFGSTRTVQRGGKLVASFHEGVDIAATQRDRRGNPLDPIYAVAPGKVVFVNPHSGNSSYGKYVLIEHTDPSIGPIYTLYAHLASVDGQIRADRLVEAGDEIGIMGATSNTTPPIPASRAHLHWEIDVMLNSRYAQWARGKNPKATFGNHNGQNLFGLDALDFWAKRARRPNLTMLEYLQELPPAYELILRGKTPDYFRRYPNLWKGAPHNGGPIHFTVSESGIPLSGRNATQAELNLIGNQRQIVAKVHTDILGRNGRAHVIQRQGKWQLSENGKLWAEALFY